MAQQVQNKTRTVPDTYIIIFFVVMLAALLTWTVPVGQFETKEIKYNNCSHYSNSNSRFLSRSSN